MTSEFEQHQKTSLNNERVTHFSTLKNDSDPNNFKITATTSSIMTSSTQNQFTTTVCNGQHKTGPMVQTMTHQSDGTCDFTIQQPIDNSNYRLNSVTSSIGNTSPGTVVKLGTDSASQHDHVIENLEASLQQTRNQTERFQGLLSNLQQQIKELEGKYTSAQKVIMGFQER